MGRFQWTFIPIAVPLEFLGDGRLLPSETGMLDELVPLDDTHGLFWIPRRFDGVSPSKTGSHLPLPMEFTPVET